jgi:hypothetical protein
MALDESAQQFLNHLLEVRPILISGQRGRASSPLQVSFFTARLLKLLRLEGKFFCGIARAECPGHLLHDYWMVFTSPLPLEFNFTNNLTRYQVFFSRQEPIEPVPHLAIFSPPTMTAGFAQIAALGSGPIPARYPKMPDHLRHQFAAVPPSGSPGGITYRPCDVILKNGRRVDRVYIVPEDPYIVMWGVWPEDDPGKTSVQIQDVATIDNSRHRLPPNFAEQLYQVGESGMGYLIFTVIFNDGSRLPMITGGAVDSIDYPPGKGPEDIAEVQSNVVREDPKLQDAPGYRWCLFSE